MTPRQVASVVGVPMLQKVGKSGCHAAKVRIFVMKRGDEGLFSAKKEKNSSFFILHSSFFCTFAVRKGVNI
ncbi:MAG: hypothetical protein IJ649_03245, partial [Oscillospiraceae bacterium]|nr:hypothetical protein [Oscillospiraceae bacterium]